MPLGCLGIWLLLDHTRDLGAALINPMFLFNELMLPGFLSCAAAGKVDRAEVTSASSRGSG